MYFSFSNPGYLFLLLFIPVIVFLHFYSIRNVPKKSLRFANFEAIANVKGIDFYSKDIKVPFLNILIVCLLVFSISGLTLNKEIQASSFSFVIAIDSSQSMGATDIYPDRLYAAKETAIDFVNSIPINTKIGVISFGGNSFIEQEISEDKGLLKTSINSIESTKFGGTDIYEAIMASSGILKNEQNKAIILLSDGQINVGNIYDAVEYAKDKEILVHTIGIGTVEGGNTSFGISKMDEDILKSLAYNTGGKYFNADNKEKMQESFKQIAPLTKRFGSINLSVYLIIAVMVLFILEQLLISSGKIST